jgi:hypothetical protein
MDGIMGFPEMVQADHPPGMDRGRSHRIKRGIAGGFVIPVSARSSASSLHGIHAG